MSVEIAVAVEDIEIEVISRENGKVIDIREVTISSVDLDPRGREKARIDHRIRKDEPLSLE